MKMPRFFILIGACALAFALTLCTIESAMRPSWANPLPVMRADPWAGDPEEPGFAKQLPFDDDGEYSRIATPYETSASTTIGIESIRGPWWAWLSGFLLPTSSFRNWR